MQVEKSIVIHATCQEVFEAYQNLNVWKEALSDVVDIQVTYDDSVHQEFDMTVLRQGKKETVHSIRFCFPNESIEIFQTQPPPMLSSMSGVWSFSPCDEGTCVKATRNFEVKPGCTFEPSILEGFLEKNLRSFKQWIESHALCPS